MVTIGVLSVSLGLCYAFCHVAAMTVQQGANLSARQEALAAAESGLQVALRHLAADPTWPGQASGLGDPARQADTPELRYEVSVCADPDDPWALQATSTGTVRRTATGGLGTGELAAQRVLVAKLRRERLLCGRYALAGIGLTPGAPGDVDLPEWPRASAEYAIRGDVFANNDVLCMGFTPAVVGKAVAYDRITGDQWFQQGVQRDAPRLARPPICAEAFAPTYSLGSHGQSAYLLPAATVSGGTFPPSHTGNAAGVCFRQGDLTLESGSPIRINGTLVVAGNLTIRSADVTVAARDLDGDAFDYDVDDDGQADAIRFPAIVCTGSITIQDSGVRLVARGGVYAGAGIYCRSDTDDREITVTGGMVGTTVHIDDASRSRFTVTHDAAWTDHRAAPGFCRWVVGRLKR